MYVAKNVWGSIDILNLKNIQPMLGFSMIVYIFLLAAIKNVFVNRMIYFH